MKKQENQCWDQQQKNTQLSSAPQQAGPRRLFSVRKVREGELAEEDKRDLALLGSSGGEGATLVDSRESTYSSQGGWTS